PLRKVLALSMESVARARGPPAGVLVVGRRLAGKPRRDDGAAVSDPVSHQESRLPAGARRIGTGHLRRGRAALVGGPWSSRASLRRAAGDAIVAVQLGGGALAAVAREDASTDPRRGNATGPHLGGLPPRQPRPGGGAGRAEASEAGFRAQPLVGQLG